MVNLSSCKFSDANGYVSNIWKKNWPSVEKSLTLAEMQMRGPEGS